MMGSLRAAGIVLASLLLAGACVPSDRPGRQDRENPRPSSPVGTWRLTAIDGAPLGRGSVLEVQLGADGQLSGRLDCNRIGGTWQLANGSRFSTGPLYSTKMGCLDVDGARTASFLSGLEGGASLILDGNRMELTVSGGNVGRFTRMIGTP